MLWFFFPPLTPLPSSHRAVFCSPRLNGRSSIDDWEEDPVDTTAAAAAACPLQIQIDRVGSRITPNLVLHPLKISASSVYVHCRMDYYHNNVRQRHFHGCDSVNQRPGCKAIAVVVSNHVWSNFKIKRCNIPGWRIAAFGWWCTQATMILWENLFEMKLNIV